MSRFWITVTGLAMSLGAATSFAAEADGAACRAATPADFDAGPSRWQGPCPGGVADGLGVMRIGTAEPYQFFLGEMKAGLPVRGLLKLSGGWMTASHFDKALKAQSEPEGRDMYPIFQLGGHAAHATAKRFKAAGNARSAAYYERLAKTVENGLPE
ncbi:hypothetical protein AB4851_07215 [Burkholderia sp. 22PA0099]|uniref:hypothetical protein n=1 Tax=Burkholderia sp. 22PA0099 TaxID=3237372 RepID=UPI0039C0485B